MRALFEYCLQVSVIVASVFSLVARKCIISCKEMHNIVYKFVPIFLLRLYYLPNISLFLNGRNMILFDEHKFIINVSA